MIEENNYNLKIKNPTPNEKSSEKIENPKKKYLVRNIKRKKRTCIGIISSHDDPDKNNKLVVLLEEFLSLDKDVLKNYTVIFTGGTYDRVIACPNIEEEKDRPSRPIKEMYFKTLMKYCGVIRLSKRSEGGVTLLSDLVVKHCISVLWFFLSPRTHHWLIPENLALMRLCEQWSVKKLITWGSILEWIHFHTKNDQKLNSINILNEFNNYEFDESDRGRLFNYTNLKRKVFIINSKMKPPDKNWEDIKLKIGLDPKKSLENWKYENIYNNTIALIAHDAMKVKMTEFAIYYEEELKKFNNIVTTSTTGKEILDAIPLSKLKDKIGKFHSETKGGDIEIAAEIIKGKCKIVFFLIDLMIAHPHIDDIRTVFAACMIHDDIVMLTNEVCAREWFEARLKKRYDIIP